MRLFASYFIVLSCLLACKPKVTSVREPSSFGGSGSAPRYWRSSNLPLTINVADDFFVDDFAPLAMGQLNPFEVAMKAWDDQVNVQLFSINDNRTTNFISNNLDDYDDAEFGIYRLNTWFPNVTDDALAIAQYFYMRRNVGRSNEYNEIIHADIMINTENHNFYLDPAGPKFNRYDLQTVVLHELGHFIGIDHLSGEAVMNAFLSPGEEKRVLFLNDRNAVKNIYQPSAPALILSGMSAAGESSEVHPDEGTKGRGIIELRANGECHHYENGELVHTHKTFISPWPSR